MPRPFAPLTAMLCFIFTLCFAAPNAHGDSVFSNLTSPGTQAVGSALLGAEFTPGANYQLTDVVASINNLGGSVTTLDSFIFSDSGGLPGTELTSLSSIVPANSDGPVTSGAPSSPLALMSGTPYWLVMDPGLMFWETQGSPSVTAAMFNGSSWVILDDYLGGNDDFQFQIDGTPVAATPEPSSLISLGSGALAVMGVLRRKIRV